MKTRILLIVMLAFLGLSGRAQIMFQKTYGGTGTEIGYSVQQTSDGGYVMVGFTGSFGAGQNDVYVIKTTATGDTMWTKTYGTVINDEGGEFIQETTDGGYIIVGTITDTVRTDIYLIKLTTNGDTLWTKRFSQGNEVHGHCVRQTIDGGYIIVGEIAGFGAGDWDLYAIKTDSLGGILWAKTYGGWVNEFGYSVQQTTDGGFVLIGASESFASAGTGPYGVYLIKLNSIGDTLWTKIYINTDSTFSYSHGTSIQQTNDGGFIITGFTGDGTANTDNVYLIKTDSAGNTIWTKTYGGSYQENGYFVQQTTDGGYIISGFTNSFGAGGFDVYLLKTDSVGNLLWSKTYGSNNYEAGGYLGQQTTDGGFIIAGDTYSFGAGGSDFYLIKTDSLGNSGCHEGNPATITHTPITIESRTPTIINSGCSVSNPHTLVNSGCIINTLCTTVGIEEIKPQPSLLLSPNPFTTTTTLTLQGTYHNPSLFIYNLMGQEVKSLAIGSNNTFTIHRNNLPAGMYFYKVIEENKEVIGIGKMVVE